MKRLRMLHLFCLIAVSGCAGGRPLVLESEAQGRPYRLLTFKPAQPHERFPLLLALHGTGETNRHYFEIWKKEAERRKVMVLAPAVESLDLEAFYQLVEEIARRYPVDREKILIAGVSSGALVARWLVVKRPLFWKGVILAASPTGEHWAEGVEAGHFPPILFVHGGQDKQFKLEEIIQQFEILKKRGVQAALFSYPDAGHEQRPEWSRRIFDWIKAQTHSTMR